MPSTPRLSEYATNALETIRKELRMFSISDVQNASNATNGQQITSVPKVDLNMLLAQLMSSGFTEDQAIAFIKNGRSDVLDNNKLVQLQQCNQRLPGILSANFCYFFSLKNCDLTVCDCLNCFRLKHRF